jgi:hypothetical protein
VADEELVAATIAPERSHLLETCYFLGTTLFYRHRPHVLILDELAILLAGVSISLAIRFLNWRNIALSLIDPNQPILNESYGNHQ